MVLDDIVGQRSVVRYIKNILTGGKVAHAYIFCGPDGVQKSLVANILASALNCKEKGNDPCGKCSSCLKAKDGNHPDIINIKTDKNIIHVKEMRELQKDMLKKPYQDGVKVYIIHSADKMNDEAQNCLLKSLEEPPNNVILILLVQNQYSMLKTILSRCQCIKFRRAPERDIKEYLEHKFSVPEGEARCIAALSNGIVKNAEEFLNDDVLKKSRDEVINIARYLYKGDKLKVLSNVDFFISNKDKIIYIAGIMTSWFRDILIYKECMNDKYLINLDKKDIIIDESTKFTYNSLNNIINYINHTVDNIKSNVNYQLSIEMMLLHIQEG